MNVPLFCSVRHKERSYTLHFSLCRTVQLLQAGDLYLVFSARPRYNLTVNNPDNNPADCRQRLRFSCLKLKLTFAAAE